MTTTPYRLWVHFGLIIFATALLITALVLIRSSSTGEVKSAISSNNGYNWPYEDALFTSQLNSYRSTNSKSQLVRSKCLTNAARAWSKSMSAAGSMTHSPNGFVDSYCPNGSFSGTGEIVQWSGTALLSTSTLNNFKNSPSHNTIMLASPYDYVGTGFFYDHNTNRTWITAIFGDCNSGCPSDVTSTPNDNLGAANSSCRVINTGAKTIFKNQNFSAEMTLFNTGATTWLPSSHRLVPVAPSNGSSWGISSIALTDTRVNPGMTGSFKANLNAQNSGNQQFNWQLNDSVGNFGDTCSKTINIKTISSSGTTPQNTESGATGFYSPPGAKPISAQAKQLLSTVEVSRGDVKLDGTQLESELRIFQNEILTLKGKLTSGNSIKIVVYSDPITFNAQADSAGNWLHKLTNLPVGDHQVEIVELDAAGNQITDPIPLLKLFIATEGDSFGAVNLSARSDDGGFNDGSGVIYIVSVVFGLVLATAGGSYFYFYSKQQKKINSLKGRVK